MPILPVDDSLGQAGKSGSGSSSTDISASSSQTAVAGRGRDDPSASALSSASSSGALRFGIIVFVVRGDSKRQWRSHEVEMMELVAEQAAIALCHAAVLEDAQRRQEELIEKNYALDIARDRAEMAVRARNDFLTVMNHELRTPLHDIFGLVSLLQLEDEPLSREQRKMLGVIMRSSRLMCSMVRDVLAFSRMEENALVLEYAPFDLHLVLRDAAQLSWPLAHSKKLTFVYNVSHDMPRFVVGDERRLLQMMLNVIGRAVECTAMGSVSVKMSVEKPKLGTPAFKPPDYGHQQPWELAPARDFFVLRVDVTDTGPGHAEGEASVQFQPFGQSKSDNALSALPSTSAEVSGGALQHLHGTPGVRSHMDMARAASGAVPGDGQLAGGAVPGVARGAVAGGGTAEGEGTYRGSGLGMMICHKFAEMMGGTMSIESQGRGRGSTVSFTVQVERDQVGAKRRQQQEEQLEAEGEGGSVDSHGMETEWEVLDSYIGDLEGLHVMVVEDNPVNKKTARLMLERLLCRVTAVETAAECLEWLSRGGASNAVDVVLLDICMPGVDGFEIARRICHMFRPDERPLLLGLSARASSGMREACLNAGMDGVLFKPVTLLELGSALCEVLTAGS